MVKEKKLFDIAKKARKFSYRIQNFFKYRLLVNSKHILLIGGQNSQLKQDIVKNFSDTWRIANIDYESQEGCELNLQIPQNELISIEQIQEMSESIKSFSKHYECIIFLPETQNKTGDLSSPEIFEQYDQFQMNITQPAILASHLASKFLTTNGLILYKGDEKSFNGANAEEPAYSLSMNQINNLNLIIGERDDIDIDAFSYTLLDRDMSKDLDSLAQFENQNQSQEQKYEGEGEEQKKEIISQEKQEQRLKAESKYMSECIREWAEGAQRPLSGAFIKWNKNGDKIEPKLF